MFKGLGQMGQMMKQAQQLQKQMAEIQEKLPHLQVTGQSGGGLVTVTMNGKGDLCSLKIDPSLLKPEEADVLEDLIIAAFNDAKAKADHLAADEMEKVTGGLSLPGGMKLPF